MVKQLIVAATITTVVVTAAHAFTPEPEPIAESAVLMVRGGPATMDLSLRSMEAVEEEMRNAHAMPQEACRYSGERSGSARVEGAELVFVDAGSGSLRVEGRPGLTEVRVVGRLCASEEEYLEHMSVSVETRGGRIAVITRYPEDRQRWGENYARIDLVVEVPAGMAADIDDSSGSMEIMDVGELRIEDGSGSIRVSRAGRTIIEDGSGGIDLSEIRGNVEIDDGSGEVEVRDVAGHVRLDDGSGQITVRQVTGSVEVRDGSGSIDVAEVDGDFRVLEDGSGGVSVSGVKGRVDIPRDERDRRRSWIG